MNYVPFDKIKNISGDANEMWTLWKSFFLDILNKHAPITYILVNPIQYWGGGIMPPIGFSYAASKRFAVGR